MDEGKEGGEGSKWRQDGKGGREMNGGRREGRREGRRGGRREGRRGGK